MSNLKVTTDSSFKEDISKGITLVDFYADWCGPCKVMEPLLDGISKDDTIKDKVRFFKLDVDANPEVSKQYDIMSIPCVIIFKDGVEINKFVGVAQANRYLIALRGIV